MYIIYKKNKQKNEEHVRHNYGHVITNMRSDAIKRNWRETNQNQVYFTVHTVGDIVFRRKIDVNRTLKYFIFVKHVHSLGGVHSLMHSPYVYVSI